MKTPERLSSALTSARNETLILSFGLYSASRKAMLVGLGAAAVAIDMTGAVAERLEERGEMAGIALRERIDRALDHEADQKPD